MMTWMDRKNGSRSLYAQSARCVLLALAALFSLSSFAPSTGQATAGATITVNSTSDTNSRDGLMTLREAMLLATGDLGVGTLDAGETSNVSGSPGAASGDTIRFSAAVFPVGAPATITLATSLPWLDTSGDTIDAVDRGALVQGKEEIGFTCLTLASDSNTVRGLRVTGCFTAIRVTGSLRSASHNTIGPANVISGNDYGLSISGARATGNSVIGNFIGTDATGTLANGNKTGLIVGGGANANIIGGTTVAARNVISANRYQDVLFGDAAGNVVQGNFIGTDATGMLSLEGDGLHFCCGARDNIIGGAGPGEGNIITGRFLSVFMSGKDTQGNVLKGNHISVASDGRTPLDVVEGITIYEGPHDNVIGGAAPGEGNVIAFNAGVGVNVDGGDEPGATVRNTIRGNRIYANGWQGIDNKTGGNTELPPPTLTGKDPLTGTTCPNCTVDIYSDSEDEGETYHGAAMAGPDGSIVFPGAVAGPNVTATATDAAGNTSEFSEPFVISPGATGLLPGDVDCSGGDMPVSAVDSLKVLRFVAGLSVSQHEPCTDISDEAEWGWKMGDVDCSGAVTAVDSLKILRFVAGLPVSLPGGCPAIGPD